MNRISMAAALLAFVLFSCNVNKAKVDDRLEKYFSSANATGCFTMLNNIDGKITVYNLELDTQRVTPGASFNILSSLIGLQTGKISSEKMIISWDGVRRKREWDRNASFTEAFSLNNPFYFEEVARRIGQDTLRQWIDSLSYGNKISKGAVDSFWFNNSLAISPDEQLGLMKRLYFDQLPFAKSVQETVRAAMLKEDKTTHRISYVSADVADGSGKKNGWTCGWIEENKHVYFFVTLIKTTDKESDAGSVAANISRDILKEYGFFQGKK